MARDQRRDDAIRITTAASSRNDSIAARQRRYVWSMMLRTACFVGAVVAGAGFGLWWLCWILIVGAVGLPYVAVVVANVHFHGTDAVDLPDTAYRPELGATGPVGGPADTRADTPADTPVEHAAEPRAGHR
ncbi:DUF3099 domain-containing protein [Nocardioides ferulae]|uniref:DUF3099 domain-containing protein n=1 Tax=Nocardioides ferulae TaxID=2340821 RepID=UPI000EB595C7|nr:DUF3099 domain-containing protein [Nocardioides ferulae]